MNTTLLMFMLKQNVNQKQMENFFEFADPFLQQSGFQMLAPSPRIYMINGDIPNIKIMDIVKKIKILNGYSGTIQSIHSGKMKKI